MEIRGIPNLLRVELGAGREIDKGKECVHPTLLKFLSLGEGEEEGSG